MGTKETHVSKATTTAREGCSANSAYHRHCRGLRTQTKNGVDIAEVSSWEIVCSAHLHGSKYYLGNLKYGALKNK